MTHNPYSIEVMNILFLVIILYIKFVLKNKYKIDDEHVYGKSQTNIVTLLTTINIFQFCTKSSI